MGLLNVWCLGVCRRNGRWIDGLFYFLGDGVIFFSLARNDVFTSIHLYLSRLGIPAHASTQCVLTVS